MTCKVIPFPLSRRRAFIRKHAAIMATLSPDAAERHLSNQLRIQCSALARRGVAPRDVDREHALLAAAIRAEVAHVAVVYGGVA